jgi:hypothetical protein
VAAGNLLAQEVLAAAQRLPLDPNDVVDVHFIGHSRGAVVISQAIATLPSLAAGFEPLQAGYLKMTMLDPHPARNATPGFYDAKNSHAGRLAVERYLEFQAKAVDPDVVVPGSVAEAEDYYQNTLVRDLSGKESILNLWGEYEIASPVPISLHNLTGPNVGHYEVITYYLDNVVNKGLTVTPF